MAFWKEEAMSKIEFHGYFGDGIVQLGDTSDASFISEIIVLGATGAVQVDVGPFIKSLVESGERFAGFMVKPAETMPVTTLIRFVSSETESFVNWDPYLDLTIEP
jgi:hypothetical protein